MGELWLNYNELRRVVNVGLGRGDYVGLRGCWGLLVVEIEAEGVVIVGAEGVLGVVIVGLVGCWAG